jgi:hypothetical protein
VSLFGSSELENLKYINVVYALYQELYVIILKNKFISFFISEKFLNKRMEKIYIKAYNN